MIEKPQTKKIVEYCGSLWLLSAYHKGNVYISQNFLYFKQTDYDLVDEFVFVVSLSNVTNFYRIDDKLIAIHLVGDYKVNPPKRKTFFFFSYLANIYLYLVLSIF